MADFILGAITHCFAKIFAVGGQAQCIDSDLCQGSGRKVTMPPYPHAMSLEICDNIRIMKTRGQET